jgi:hypothetical protein
MATLPGVQSILSKITIQDVRNAVKSADVPIDIFTEDGEETFKELVTGFVVNGPVGLGKRILISDGSRRSIRSCFTDRTAIRKSAVRSVCEGIALQCREDAELQGRSPYFLKYGNFYPLVEPSDTTVSVPGEDALL